MGFRTYSSSFGVTENPISEQGLWINGGVTALDWTNVRSGSGHVFGTQPGNSANPFDDSVAILGGVWRPDQAAEATVFISSTPAANAEVEILLRSTFSAHFDGGYEFNASCVPGTTYMQIVRLPGFKGTQLGDFVYVAQRSDIGVANGDIIAATVIGSTCTMYKNGVQVLQGTDSTYTSGSPGLGFYLQFQTGNNANYGFSHYAANDAGVIPSVGPLPAGVVNPVFGSFSGGWA